MSAAQAPAPLPGLIDSHCHLEPGDFRLPDGADERPLVLERAAAAGLSQLVVVGAGRGLGEVDNALTLVAAHDHLYATVAVHPHDARAVVSGSQDEAVPGPRGEALWQAVAEAARAARVVGVGETGLDYFYHHSTPAEQQALLARFVGLAQAVQKPLTLHIRDAHEDAWRILAEAGGSPRGGVVHCFTGDASAARRWLDLGFHLSFSGIVTFKKATALQEACRLVPPDRLLLETDCPYLAPVPLRGRRNEPAHLVYTARFVAQLRGVSAERLAEDSAAATRALFGMPERGLLRPEPALRP